MSYSPLQGLPPPIPDRDGLLLAAVGDMMFGRGVSATLADRHPDALFARATPLLDADLVCGNLECPLADCGEAVRTTNAILKGLPSAAVALRNAGFDIVGLANNHTLDYGVEAAHQTLHELNRADVDHVGLEAGTPPPRDWHRIESEKGRVAFLAYTPFWTVQSTRNCWVGHWTPDRVEAQIRDARDAADFCVVMLHFGSEGVPYPPPECRQMARAAVDAGADLVLGHHPHILGPLELYQSKLIAYSLGDFIFDSDDPLRRQTAVFRFQLTRNGYVGVECAPVIVDKCFPRPAEGNEGAGILRRLEDLSAALLSPDYPGIYYRVASDRFLAGQGEALSRAFRQRQFGFLLRRLGHVRLRHLRLLIQAIWRRLARGG